jgi:3-hydroxyacyl-CoA dehydrogenase
MANPRKLATREVSDRESTDSKYRAAPLLKAVVAGGRRGRKSGPVIYN